MPSWPIAVWRVLPLPKEELIRAPQSIFSRCLGVNVYTASILTDAGESREGLAAPVVSLALGLDFRVSRNLYLEVAARYIGDFASWNFGYDSEPLLANEGFFGGFSV